MYIFARLRTSRGWDDGSYLHLSMGSSIVEEDVDDDNGDMKRNRLVNLWRSPVIDLGHPEV